MRIWAVVYNPAFTLVVSDGPIYLESVTVTRSLDRLTRLSAPVAGNDIRALQHITARNVVEIYIQPTTPAHLPSAPARLLGAFIIDNLDMSVDGDRINRSIRGTGVMLALKDKLTLPGLTYDDATIENIFNGVGSLSELAGWTADVEAGISTNQTSVRFDGTHVFKSMQAVTEIQGLHLRHTAGTVVEVGAFGTANGYRLETIEGDTGIVDYDTLPFLIESMEIIEDAAGDFYNYVLGFGAGQGDARLTLEKSTRPGKITVNDGSRDHYVIKDDASIATYGQIERMVQIKTLAPVGTSEAQQVNAANALHDGLQANLDRHKDPQEKYRATVRNVPDTLQPGDRLRVIYQGAVWKDGLSAPYKWKDINADFWVMSVIEVVNSDGAQVQLEISNVDRYQQNAAEIIVGMVDSIAVQGIGVQPYPVQFPWGPFQQPIDTVTDVTFQFPVFDNVLRLVSVKAFILRDVWTAVAGTALGGGDHRHKMFDSGFATTVPANNMLYSAWANAGGTAAQTIGIYSNPTSAPDVYTKDASGTHTHDTEFAEVQKDTVKPEDVSLTINGTLVSSTLFPTSGGSDIEEVDITAEVLAKAGGFRAWHDVLIECGTNRGDISVVFFIDVEVGTVRV